ncbi:MAG: MBL fold metallo-hydrolase [Selenomonadaceae bacterium]|nr:MBL fold metallo-hydrolase [Selenomonadaceae bacterium]
MKKILFYALLIANCALFFVGCGGQAKEEPKPEPKPEVETQAEVAPAPAQNVNGDLKISMLDVGQGDAILIQTKSQTILIDASDTDERDLLVDELERFSVTKIDKLILTHPHADHIGSAKALINPSKKEITANPYLEKISVDEVYDNGIASTSPLYKSYLKAVDTKGIAHHSLTVGDTLDFGDGVKFNVLYPTPELVNAVNNGGWKSDPNNESVVGKLTYKKFSMIFTGDAEKQVEKEILANNKTKDLKCDVLKSGHHGSYTASSKEFVAAVNPSCVLISAGPDEERRNTYGHPHLEPLEIYLAQGIDKKNILCTRWNGTITITSDGQNFSVVPDKKEDWLDKWITQKKKDKKK